MNHSKALFFLKVIGVLLLISPNLHAQSPVTPLAELIEQDWNFRLREDPLLATSVGVHTYDDQLPEATVAAARQRARYQKELLRQLSAIDVLDLNEDERISYEFLRFILEDDTAQAVFRSYLVPINAEGGFHTGFVFAMQRMPQQTVGDYENYLARLQAYGTYTDQHIQQMKTGLAQDIASPQRVARNALATVAPYVTETAEAHILYQPFKTLPPAISQSDRNRLQQAARAALDTVVIPAMRRLQSFMKNVYVPQAPEAIGVSERPDGRAFYEQRVRYFTTLPMTPEEVFAQGEQE